MRKNILKLMSLFLAATLLLSLASCTVSVKANELSDGYTRKQTGKAHMDENFTSVMADFSFELFHNALNDDDANDLISPLSALLCLALIANGADGETLSQMESAFGMDMETLNESLYAYMQSLPTLNDCKMRQANSIWFRNDDSLRVEEDFLQTNADWYAAEVYASPFDGSTVKDINNWVKKNTDGMIESIVDRIDPSSVMFLINTLVFDAKWYTEYEKNDIREAAFTNTDGSQTKVEMMYSEESCYWQGGGFIGFSKAYKGNAYSFVGLLPEEGRDIYEAAASLDGETWLDLWSSRRGTPVNAGIPEFTYDASMFLNPALQAMGMTDMFSREADFSRLGQSSEGNIYCGSVQQKTFIEVNRHGTKAAAVTWGDMVSEGCEPEEPIYVILDRPFVYAIVDNATGLPIFLGVVSSLR